MVRRLFLFCLVEYCVAHCTPNDYRPRSANVAPGTTVFFFVSDNTAAFVQSDDVVVSVCSTTSLHLLLTLTVAFTRSLSADPSQLLRMSSLPPVYVYLSHQPQQ